MTFFRDRSAACGYVLTRIDTLGGREGNVRRLKVLPELIFGKPGQPKKQRKTTQIHPAPSTTRRRFQEIKDVVERRLRTE